MAGAAGEPSAKRAKVDEAEEEEDPLVRRREEVVRLLEKASAKGRGNARAKEELLTLCADFEAKNEKLLGRLLPELWQKIVDENLHVMAKASRSFCCRYSSRIFCHISGGSRHPPKVFSFLAWRSAHKVNSSSFARALSSPFPFALAFSNKRTTSSFLSTRGSSSSFSSASSTLARFVEGSPAARAISSVDSTFSTPRRPPSSWSTARLVSELGLPLVCVRYFFFLPFGDSRDDHLTISFAELLNLN